MAYRIRGHNPLSVLGLFVAFSLAGAAATAQLSVAALAASLASTCTPSAMIFMVAEARGEGLSDEQIANGFGRTSTVTTCPDALSAAYQSFAASSDLSADALSAAYGAGVETADRTGIGGSTGGGGMEDAFDPPSGGSGGGGGSVNE